MKSLLSLTKFVLLVMGILLLDGCSSLRESIKSRELLGKCEYELKEVRVRTLDFAPVITFDNSTKKINVEQPTAAELLLLADRIRKGDFNLSIKKLSMDAIVEVDNPNEQEVILDSMFYDCFLDETYLMKIGHYEHSVIPPRSVSDTRMTFDVPLNTPLKNIINAQDVVVKGKVWLRLKLTKKTEVTLPVPVKVKRAIPREQINARIEKEKERIINDLIKKLEKEAGGNKVKDGIKKLFGG